MLSENLPLRNEYMFAITNYFPKSATLSTEGEPITHGERRDLTKKILDDAGRFKFQKSKLVTRFALIAESGAFCYRRNRGVGRDLRMLEGKPQQIYEMMRKYF